MSGAAAALPAPPARQPAEGLRGIAVPARADDPSEPSGAVRNREADAVMSGRRAGSGADIAAAGAAACV